MTTSFFTANTQYNPIHDVDTVYRPVAPAGATAPLRRASSTSKAGWAVSGIAALVGLATFSIVSVYAIDEFAQTPAPLSTSTPVPAADTAVPPPAPVAPPAPPSAPAVKPVESPRILVVPSYRSAPVPSQAPEVTTPPAPVASPAPPEPTTPSWPPVHWDLPSHWHPPTNCGIVRCDHDSPTDPASPTPE
ncbi:MULTISPECIES: hypothetical protein [unclassified Mycobacterium]|uniref:hypothetical protein n=1 Tax=unclassified Mycobacterium TaxID=2642494 RepID=UPI0029C9A9AF|nr:MULTISPECIES: hypothetical protein [unclassified Mycobacterium]